LSKNTPVLYHHTGGMNSLLETKYVIQWLLIDPTN